MIDIRNAELLGIGKAAFVCLDIGVRLSEHENVLEVCESTEEEALSLKVVDILFGDGFAISLTFEIVDNVVCHCYGVVAVCPHCGIGGICSVVPVVTLGATSGVLERLLHTVAGTHFILDHAVAGVPTGGTQIVVSTKGRTIEAIVGCELDLCGLLEFRSLLKEVLIAASKADKCYNCKYV